MHPPIMKIFAPSISLAESSIPYPKPLPGGFKRLKLSVVDMARAWLENTMHTATELGLSGTVVAISSPDIPLRTMLLR